MAQVIGHKREVEIYAVNIHNTLLGIAATKELSPLHAMKDKENEVVQENSWFH